MCIRDSLGPARGARGEPREQQQDKTDSAEEHHAQHDPHGRRVHRVGQGAEGDQRGPEVHDEHGPAVRVADLQEPVVQMASVRGERGLAAPGAPHDRQHQVRGRDRDDGQRQQQRDVHRHRLVHGRLLRAREQLQRVRVDLTRDGDRARREHQADQHRPRVAHEDARGMHVVRQEAQAHAHQDRREQRRRGGGLDAVRHPDAVGVEEERGRGDAHHARREAVEAVDEVDRVDGDDDQRDREQGALPLGQRHRAEAGDGQPQDRQTLHDHDAGGDHLAAQLDQGVDLELVVQDADQPDQRGTREQGARFVGVLEDGAEVCQVVGDQQSRAQPEEHGDTAEARSGFPVHVTCPDLRHRPGHDRELPHRPREQVRHRGRDAERQQVFTHRLPHRSRWPSQPHTLAMHAYGWGLPGSDDGCT